MLLEHGADVSADEIHVFIVDSEMRGDLVNFREFANSVWMMIVTSVS